MRDVASTARRALCAIALVFVLVLPVMAAKPAAPPGGAAASGQADYDRLVDRFFDEAYFRFHPTAGTEAGFHKYDRQLEDYSRASVAAQVAALKSFLTKFESLDPKRLSPTSASDRDLVMAQIRAALLDLETVRMWEKDPDRYSSGISSSVFLLMSRKFAPPEERLRAVIARERLVPKVFEAARANLKDPPRLYTEVALEQIPGILGFFKDDVPAAFEAVKDKALLEEFAASNKGVLAALGSYQTFLRDDLLPRSSGDFRLGRETYAKKLLYEEMVDIPLDRLLKIGYEDLRRNQERVKETAARIDPKRAPREILADLEKDHPAPDKLLQAFRDTLGGLRDFIVQHRIITLPSPDPPILEETPPFARALTSASMETPGPYEAVAKEAFFNVTLPDPSWTPGQVEEHMAGFNRGTIISTAIHEAYPGHYMQFLWLQRVDSKVRKLLGSGTNGEGWAHYCEQMMLDEGYGDGDPKLRLGQLLDALLRDARYIVGIEMHTGSMTYEQGIDFFVKEGYQTHINAERETRRGTSDPTYLVYTLGKLQILKLRDDYRALRGPGFTLEEFHDRVLAMGWPPLRMVRKALLGNDSPTL
ncbi:MAG TPA: DUF885 domain-containing protein [Candidatus Polarisedimenticolia bacterium]|nr:DUF885 domain-containing protein [Candidatus Polarisedimenticolia bacterium]